MKRLSHRHLVKIVGSYTDSKCFAFLMEPVAQCNMLDYLQNIESPQIPVLRKFFGCLATAVTYLHDQKMHHMDIKLENILVKRDEVFVSDFGAAHDFSRKERSTTYSPRPRTPRYTPPEIYRDLHSPKNYATDIWSLGVVFLEMTAVLRGQSLKSFHSYLPTHGNGHQYVYGNQSATHSYFEHLRTRGSGPEYDNEPLSWVKDMINRNPTARPTARAIRNQILLSSSVEQFRSFCCAGTGLWLEPAPRELGAVLEDKNEDVNIEDDFLEASELPDHAYALFNPSKTNRIQSWLNQSAIRPHPEPDTDASTDEEGMPFDIEDDEETVMPSITKKYALNGAADRLANYDFFYPSSSMNHLQRPENCENIGDELPFDIHDDDANSLNSDITIMPWVDAPNGDGAELLQALNILDGKPLSPERPKITFHEVSNESPIMAIQTSANFDTPSRTAVELDEDISPENLIVCNPHTLSDEMLGTLSLPSEDLDSTSRPTTQILGKNGTELVCADEVRAIIQSNTSPSSQSNLEPSLLKLIAEIPANEVERLNLLKNLDPPSQTVLETPLDIPIKPIPADKDKSLIQEENLNLPSQSNSKAPPRRKHKISPRDKAQALTLENLR